MLGREDVLQGSVPGGHFGWGRILPKGWIAEWYVYLRLWRRHALAASGFYRGPGRPRAVRGWFRRYRGL